MTTPSPDTVTPSVSIGSPSEVYAGSEAIISCLVNLGSYVDTPLAVNAEWERMPSPLSSDSRVTIIPTMQLSALEYRTELSISLASSTIDTGLYTCTAVGNSSNLYVEVIAASYAIGLNVQSELIACCFVICNNEVILYSLVPWPIFWLLVLLILYCKQQRWTGYKLTVHMSSSVLVLINHTLHSM